MKYLSQLSRDEIIELVKVFTEDTFQRVVEMRETDTGIDITVEVKLEDDERECGYIILEETYTLEDYHVRIWDYYTINFREMLSEYRKKLLDKFGKEYALDYLFYH